MKRSASLRFRITFSLLSFAAVFSLAVALGIYFVLEDIEREMVDERVQSELEYVLRQSPPAPDRLLRLTFDTELYWQTQPSATLPKALQQLPVGLHSWRQDKQSAYVLIQSYRQGRIYLIKDATEFENRERAIEFALVLMVVLVIGVALVLGRMLSSRVIAPVTRLAEQVAELNPSSGRDLTGWAAAYAPDEVGQLAHKFELYHQRMAHFIQREQAFTADASHELRTPLAIIQNAAELLIESPHLTERELKTLERILRASERMSQMLELLLMLARETPAERQPDAELTLMSTVLLELVEQYRPLLLNKPVELRLELMSDFSVHAGRNLLLMVLGNLLKNAIEHTQQGEVLIQLKQQRVLLRDTGEGIADEMLPQLFERFYRKKSNKVGSNGIGLSLVKRICDRMGWQVFLSSQLGRGTEVELVFIESSI